MAFLSTRLIAQKFCIFFLFDALLYLFLCFYSNYIRKKLKAYVYLTFNSESPWHQRGRCLVPILSSRVAKEQQPLSLSWWHNKADSLRTSCIYLCYKKPTTTKDLCLFGYRRKKKKELFFSPWKRFFCCCCWSGSWCANYHTTTYYERAKNKQNKKKKHRSNSSRHSYGWSFFFF